jgi:hypothetical protein
VENGSPVHSLKVNAILPKTVIKRQRLETMETLFLNDGSLNGSIPQKTMIEDQPVKRNKNLRMIGISLLILWLIDIVSGSSWAFGYSLATAAVHIGIALLMIVIAAMALVMSRRFRGGVFGSPQASHS